MRTKKPINLEELHLKAVGVAKNYKKAETALIEVLMEADEHRLFENRKHTSLFGYATLGLNLSRDVAYVFIAIARKALEVPELQEEIKKGNLSISNARRIAPVLSASNDAHQNQEWIKKASTLSNRELEKDHPELPILEKATYVNTDRIKLQVGLSEKNLTQLKRAQDLLSTKENRAVSLEETISALTSEYLKREDPIIKAERVTQKKMESSGKLKSTVSLKADESKVNRSRIDELKVDELKVDELKVDELKVDELKVDELKVNHPYKPKIQNQLDPELVTLLVRTPIPASVLHALHLRDQGKCTHLLPNGKPCAQTRWLHIHHLIPVSQGGKNLIENLTTLCSGHHRMVHGE